VRKTSIYPRLATLLAMLVLAGCSTEPSSSGDREALQDDVGSTLKRMYVEDDGLQNFLARAYGYVIFPSVGKGGFIAGGAYGRGEVFQQGQFIGYADISQATIGAQAGGQSFSEAIAFQSPEALNLFKSGQFAFAANASAVALKAGAAASQDYDNGVAVFVDPLGGLMLEAAIGGQSFSYQPK
jgi:lipid-binding SYLF domain-containing protein